MRYVALLRGINIGGKNLIKMEDLRASFESLGFENVKSYINSGNLAFNSETVYEPEVMDPIENAIQERFGRHIDVMVREQSDIQQMIAMNPFEGQFESHKHMHVLFLKERMPRDKEAMLQVSALPGEKYVVNEREIYNLLPNGVANSLVAKGFFEKKPRVSYTGRNWRTVEKLAEL